MRKGMSLVEILITVTIIGILASIGLITMNDQVKRSRDDRRRIHLTKIQTALETYRASNLSLGYPANLNQLEPLYIDGALPIDPSSYTYYYRRIDENSYTLCAYLETGGQDDCGGNCSAPGNCNFEIKNPSL
ncbi:MAG TPA: type II secretion system protein [Patescibacteria group bacterium]|nr:type II secretion system protein [Patescibacteria group bacterium]